MLQLYENIKKRRKELGMTQEELAKKTGYTNKSSIATIESGRIDLPQSKILEFSRALNISPSDLMGWETFSYDSESSTWIPDHVEEDYSISKEDQILLDAFHSADPIDRYAVLKILGIKGDGLLEEAE